MTSKVAITLVGLMIAFTGGAAKAQEEQCPSWEALDFWQPTEPTGLIARLLEGPGDDEQGLSERTLSKIEACLAAISDINSMSDDGFTPLVEASASTRHSEIIELVLNRGANIHQANAHGLYALQSAIAFNPNPRIAEILIEHGADTSVQTADGMPLLHLAAGHTQSVEIIDFLLDLGFSADEKDDFGLTPLHYAAKDSKNLEIIERLIEFTSDIDSRNNLGWTPLHFAAFANTPNVAKILLKKGADPNAENYDMSATPVFAAAANTKYPQMFAVLAEHGADMNFLPDTEADDTVPLTVMVSSEPGRHAFLVNALLDAGASAWITDDQGMTPLDAAKVANAPRGTIELLEVAQREQSPSASEDCSRIADTEDRLACYDRGASKADPEGSEKLSKNMSWHIEREQNDLTDLTDIYLSVSANEPMQCGYERVRPKLYLRCMDNTTAVLLATNCFMADIQGYGKIRYRVDQQKMRTRRFTESTDNMALGLFNWKRSTPFLRDLMGGDKLIMEFTPFNDSPKQVSFDIYGVENALKPLRQACGW